jgi:hypothetical protein
MIAISIKERNIVERFLQKIKRLRRIATRYDKIARMYLTGNASQYCFSLDLELVVLAFHSLSPTLSREKHHHTIKGSSAGEGADRGEIKICAQSKIKWCSKKLQGRCLGIAK